MQGSAGVRGNPKASGTQELSNSSVPGVQAACLGFWAPSKDSSAVKQDVIADKKDQDKDAPFGPCRHLFEAESATALHDDGI